MATVILGVLATLGICKGLEIVADKVIIPIAHKICDTIGNIPRNIKEWKLKKDYESKRKACKP
jgi:hypothetical protein